MQNKKTTPIACIAPDAAQAMFGGRGAKGWWDCSFRCSADGRFGAAVAGESFTTGRQTTSSGELLCGLIQQRLDVGRQLKTLCRNFLVHFYVIDRNCELLSGRFFGSLD